MMIAIALQCRRPEHCADTAGALSTDLAEVARTWPLTAPTAITESLGLDGLVRVRRPSLFSSGLGGMAAVAFAALLLVSCNADAQVGLFDPSWRPGGRVVIPTPGNDASATFIGAAGARWMIAGQCTIGAASRGCALRLLANGDVDTTYGDPFQVNTALSDLAGLPGGGSYIVQSDASGQIWFARSAPGQPIAIGRINPAGTAATNPPLTFHYIGTGGSASSEVSRLVFAPDGSTYVIGSAGVAQDDTDFAIARLTPDLQLDPTFNGSGVRTIGFDSPGLARDEAYAAALQPDGRLVVAGTSIPAADGVKRWVVRLMSDGSIDPGFGVGGRFRFGESAGAVIGAVAVDAQGRVLITGSKLAVGDWDGYIVRLNPDGNFDSTFGDGGASALGFNLIPGGDDFLQALVLQPDGKIIVGGLAQRGSFAAFFASARITGSGIYDPGFGAGGVSFGTYGPVPVASNSYDSVDAMALDGQGRLMVAGSHFDGTQFRFGVGRIVTGVVLDPVFADSFE